MVHVGATIRRVPCRIIPSKLDIEPVEAAGRPDVERTLPYLLDCSDAGQRKEITEVIRKVPVRADDRRRVASQVFGLEGFPVRGQNKFGLCAGRCRAGLEGGEGLCDLAGGGNGDVDIAGLEDAAKIRLVRLALPQALECRFLVAEGLQANGNSVESNVCSAKAEMASSISTAFMLPVPITPIINARFRSLNQREIGGREADRSSTPRN